MLSWELRNRGAISKARRRKTFLELSRIKDKHFFCSWSGGKDSTLALYRAISRGGIPVALFTMLNEDGTRSRSHGLPVDFLQAQANSLGIPLITRAASWDNYEPAFIEELKNLAEEGVKAGVFGDIDMDERRDWVEKVCAEAGIEAFLPLWKEERRSLLTELLGYRFKATIVSIKGETLDERFLGMQLSHSLVKELETAGVDASGEEGEYHTAVTDGPLFSKPMKIKSKGKVFRDGYWFLDVEFQ